MFPFSWTSLSDTDIFFEQKVAATAAAASGGDLEAAWGASRA